MKRGKVYLVGAGPGDPGLLTLRARELLGRADVVLYDGLVSRGVLRWIPRTAQKRRVAKGPTRRDRFPQSEIDRLMVAEATAGKTVVRLKGGDPLLFSRGGEEAEWLRAHGIRFEIVPGVSSALAAPAYSGITLTERGLASSVAFVTGHGSDAPPQHDVDWTRLAHGVDTLVIMMGVATLKTVAARLRAAGLAAETPVAAIQWGTTRRQRSWRFTLEEAARGAVAARIESPSVLVIGPTVLRAYRRNWYPQERRWASPGFLRTVRTADRPARARPRHSGPAEGRKGR